MWTKLEVYNNDQFVGEFYTNSESKREIIEDINKRYGESKWTRYNIGN